MKASNFFGLLICTNVVLCENPGTSLKTSKIRSKVKKIDLMNTRMNSGRVRNAQKTMPVRSVQGDDEQEHPWHFQLNTSSICLFDSVENFKETFGKIKWLSNKRMRHPHLVFIPDVTTNDILSIATDGFAIDKVNFLVNVTSTSVDLATSFMFTPKKCRVNQLQSINRFNIETMEWNRPTFYPKKYNNLHGCLLMITGANEDFFFHEISKSLNFIIEEKVTPTRQEALNDENVDILTYATDSDGDQTYVSGALINNDQVVFIVPPGELYTSLEKMFIMFDAETWIAIGATFTFILIAIQIINRCSTTVQNFVYGRNIRTPTMNFIDIFMNGAQRRVPGRNFSRFMLILVIFWSLHIRTCYQSKMFEFLQADMRKSGPSTLSELGIFSNESGYYANGTYYSPNETASENAITLCPWEYFYKCLDIVQEPANQAYTMGSKLLLSVDLTRKYRNGLGYPSFLILDDIFRSTYTFTTFKPFSPFFESFNEKIELLSSNGIISYVESFCGSLKWKTQKNGPMVLTLYDLRLGFLAWGIMLVVSCCAFLLELMVRATLNRWSD